MSTSSILQLLWQISWQTAVVALVVWGVSKLSGKAPAAWRHALWVVVMIKFFIPPFAQFPADMAFWQQRQTPAERLEANKLAPSSSGFPAVPASLAMAEPFEIEAKRLRMILRSSIPRLSKGWLAALIFLVAIAVPTFRGVASGMPTVLDISKALRAQEEASGPSLEVTYTQTTSPDKKWLNKVRYVRTPGVLFAREEDHVRVSRSSYDRTTGQHLHLTKPKHIKLPASAHASVSRHMLYPFDLQSFVETTRYSLFTKPLVEYVKQGKVSQTQQVIDGHRCCRVEIPAEEDSIKAYIVFVDPGIAFNPRRIEIVWKSMKPQIIGFREYKKVASDVWFPFVHTVDLTEQNGRKIHVESKVSDVRIGRVIPHDELRVDIPPGTRVHLRPVGSFIWRGRMVEFSGGAMAFLMKRDREYRSRMQAERAGRTYQPAPAVAPAQGPGLAVTLRNNPQGSVDLQNTVQVADIDGVVAELWGAGARAVAVNDKRLTDRTMFSDGGNGTVYLSTGGAKIKTPFVVKAVGDPNALSKALSAPNGVAAPLRKLGMITEEKQQSVSVPAYVPRKRPSN